MLLPIKFSSLPNSYSKDQKAVAPIPRLSGFTTDPLELTETYLFVGVSSFCEQIEVIAFTLFGP